MGSLVYILPCKVIWVKGLLTMVKAYASQAPPCDPFLFNFQNCHSLEFCVYYCIICMAWLFLFVWRMAGVHDLEIKIKLAKYFYFYLFI